MTALRRGEDGVWRSPLLEPLTWLDHGFGGRHSQDWPPPHAAAAQQVHGDHVLLPLSAGSCGEGDALVTSASGLWVGVRTADCAPILLADPRRRVVAAVHAGWRGTVARVVLRALERMESRPEDVYAALGPAIGPCCYEVGPEVAEHFGKAGRVRLDLWASNRDQLLAAGVPRGQLGTVAPCTRCEADFHSYRRDREKAGRMVSAICLRRVDVEHEPRA